MRSGHSSYDFDSMKKEDLSVEAKKVLERNREMLQKINQGLAAKDRSEKVLFVHLATFIDDCKEFLATGMGTFQKEGRLPESGGEQKDLRARLLPVVDRISAHRSEIDELQLELESVQRDASLKTEEFRDLVQKHLEIKEKLTIEKITLDSTQKQIQELIRQNHELEEQLYSQGLNTSESQKQLQEEYEALMNRRAEVNLMVRKCEKERIRLSEENTVLKSAIVQGETRARAMERDNRDMKQQLASLSDEKENAEKTLEALQTEIDDLEYYLEKVGSEAEEARARREVARAKKLELQGSLAASKGVLDKEARGLDDEEAQVAELKRKVALAKGNLGDSEATLRDSNLEVARLQLELDFLQSKQELFSERLSQNQRQADSFRHQLGAKSAHFGLPPIEEQSEERGDSVFTFANERDSLLKDQHFRHLPSIYLADSVCSLSPVMRKNEFSAQSDPAIGKSQSRLLEISQLAELVMELSGKSRLLKDEQSKHEAEFRRGQQLKRESEKLHAEIERVTRSMQELKHQNRQLSDEVEKRQKALADAEKNELSTRELVIRAQVRSQLVAEAVDRLQARGPVERQVCAGAEIELQTFKGRDEESGLELGRGHDQLEPLLPTDFDPYLREHAAAQGLHYPETWSCLGVSFNPHYLKISLACAVPLLLGYLLLKLQII